MGVAMCPGGNGHGNAAGSSDVTGDELGAGAFPLFLGGEALFKTQNLRREAVRNLQLRKEILYVSFTNNYNIYSILFCVDSNKFNQSDVYRQITANAAKTTN